MDCCSVTQQSCLPDPKAIIFEENALCMWMLCLFTLAGFMQAGAWTVSPAVPSDNNCVLVKLTSQLHFLSFHDVIDDGLLCD